MSIHSAEQLVWDFLPQTPVVLEISPSQLTSEAGLLPMRAFDENIGLTEQFAAALMDRRRDPGHTFLEGAACESSASWRTRKTRTITMRSGSIRSAGWPPARRRPLGQSADAFAD